MSSSSLRKHCLRDDEMSDGKSSREKIDDGDHDNSDNLYVVSIKFL